MMHVLLTGGCGYIGSILTPKLLNAGYKVTVIDIMWFGNFLQEHKNLNIIQQDIRNIDDLKMEDVDVVIHLANIANDPCGDIDSKLSWEVNVLATMRLVEWAIQHNAKQFIYASSGSVYGVKEEPQVTEDLSLVPISDYNKTKMISERVLLSYKDSIAVQCIRPATVCGYSPRIRLDVSVNMLTMQALANKKITVFGGDQVRPNIHIQDITDLVLFFIEQGEKVQGIYNAGFENISIMDIANKVAASVPAEIVVTPSNDPRSYRLNSDKVLATGFNPKYNVQYAISEIIDAFKLGNIRDEDGCYNVRTMKKNQDLS
jgi:nucleoside-diphosphate-sugar epimerase